MLVEALTPGIKIMMLEKRHAVAMFRFVERGTVERGTGKIVLCCDDRDERSIALAKKLGFSLEGRLKRDSFVNGEVRDTKHFGLLREDFVP